LKKILSYEEMWEIVVELADGRGTQEQLAKEYSVSKSHINAIAKYYNVRRVGGWSQQVSKKNPDLKRELTRFSGGLFTLRVRKDLLGPAEKAQIIAGMKKTPGLSAVAYAQEFKRLPATIVKIAAEAGITLR
jgi:hypothetical protein